MGRTVVYIIGTSYSGSSLLNLLLDSQPGVRGMGEALHLAAGPGDAVCGHCARPVRECPARAAVNRNRFYGSLFDFYGNCEVLVDSSKSVGGCLGTHPFEPDLEHRVILLSKAPHEFAYSWIGHHEGATPEAAIQLWLDFYEKQMSLLARLSWFKPWLCTRIAYRELVTHTEAVIGRICDSIGCTHDPDASPWVTDTHIVAGNWMVAAQVRGRRSLFTDGQWYLRGKYSGRFNQVFYDDLWKTDQSFISQCLEIYRLREDEIRRALDELGQLDYRQHLADLTTLVNGDLSRSRSR